MADVYIDGSEGEGGGQILRTALSLAAITGKTFQIEKIRAGRQKPGLLRQHLTAVRAAAEFCEADVTDAELRSTSLTFRPSAIRGGKYDFKIGSAGSASLVMQTVLPIALNAATESTVRVSGGTHNQSAPPFEFLDQRRQTRVRSPS